jgi:hypothetical protein
MRYFGFTIVLILFLLSPFLVNAQQSSALSSFFAKQLGDSVVLSFELRAGITCNGIGIQRRVGEESMDFIGFIPGVCGNKEYAETYIFIDENPVKNERLYYRILLGDVGFSQEIEVFIPDYLSAGYVLAVEPNSGRWAIHFRNPLDVEVKLEIVNASGQVVRGMSTTMNYFVLPEWLMRKELYFFRISIVGRENQIFGKFYLE